MSYSVVLVVHVLLAVLGTGVIAAVWHQARRAATTGAALPKDEVGLLVRWASISLGLLLVSGIALDALSGGAFHERWWFRIAALSMVPLGALLGWIRRDLAKPAVQPTRIARAALGAALVLGWMITLMEVKPF